jgi:cysteinyl-tRNA synthetase
MSQIEVFNTMSGRKEAFVPLDGMTVKMYACGPTVYDNSHLGHARMFIVWDVVQRYFRYKGYKVTFVRNITDVDDKIINRARDMGITPDQLSRQYTYSFWNDMYSLNVSLPDFEPRATEYITRMLTFIEELIQKGFAYESKGDIYFEVSKFPSYGKLGKQDLEQLQSGARDQVRSQGELSAFKRNPVDFALWKTANPNELSWDSPWGKGRPGWHLECSTMIKYVLGESIDIHVGGEDLVFPHHENEIAQSEALHGKPLSKYWMHNGFVQVSAEKMSKSLGNFSTIKELLTAYSPDTIRLLVLQTHYRNPIDFTPDSLQAAKSAISRLSRAALFATKITNAENSSNGAIATSAANAANATSAANGTSAANAANGTSADDVADIKQFRGEFEAAMNNDFNTAVAIAALFAFAEKVQSAPEANKPLYALELKKHAEILGLKLEDNRKVLDTGTAARVVDMMLELRQIARTKKDFSTSDLIRKQLAELNINVMDVAGGNANWEKG